MYVLLLYMLILFILGIIFDMFFNFGMLELIIGILDLLFFILINLGFLGNINGNMNDDLKMFNGILLFFNMIE